MVHTRWEYNHVSLFHRNADPAVRFVSDVEVPGAIKHEPVHTAVQFLERVRCPDAVWVELDQHNRPGHVQHHRFDPHAITSAT